MDFSGFEKDPEEPPMDPIAYFNAVCPSMSERVRTVLFARYLRDQKTNLTAHTAGPALRASQREAGPRPSSGPPRGPSRGPKRISTLLTSYASEYLTPIMLLSVHRRSQTGSNTFTRPGWKFIRGVM